MRRSLIALWCCSGFVAACTLFTPFDGLSADPDASPREDEPLAGDASTTSSPDGTADAGSLCTPGDSIRAIEARVLALDGGVGIVCDAFDTLELDGRRAGLDKQHGGTSSLGGEAVSSCVAVRFEHPLREIVVHAGRVDNACGAYACGNDCADVARYKSFAGATLEALAFLGISSLGDAGMESTTVPVGGDARWVAVCRLETNSSPDIALDAILGVCR